MVNSKVALNIIVCVGLQSMHIHGYIYIYTTYIVTSKKAQVSNLQELHLIEVTLRCGSSAMID
jgi:hypothetical protein